MNFGHLLSEVFNTVQKNSGKLLSKDSPLNSFGGGAAVAGLATLLLKNSSLKSLAKTGSVAALGAVAYRAYQSWQQSNQNTAQALLTQQSFEEAGQFNDNNSQIILRTMIAAAAADGLIDDTEKQLITQQSGDDAEMQSWLLTECAHPASVNEIASAIGNNPALAAEAYLAARLVCGDLERKEIVFLAQLSQALNLDNQLVEKLEQQLNM